MKFKNWQVEMAPVGFSDKLTVIPKNPRANTFVLSLGSFNRWNTFTRHSPFGS